MILDNIHHKIEGCKQSLCTSSTIDMELLATNKDTSRLAGISGMENETLALEGPVRTNEDSTGATAIWEIIILDNSQKFN